MFPEDTPPSMQSLLEQAAAMQQQLVAAQQELAEARVEGTSGGGAVTATVSGAGDLVALQIDASACDPDDTETLADLVVAAVRDATTNASELAASQLGDVAGALGGLGDESSPVGKLGF